MGGGMDGCRDEKHVKGGLLTPCRSPPFLLRGGWECWTVARGKSSPGLKGGVGDRGRSRKDYVVLTCSDPRRRPHPTG